ncbi:MAG: hypothetical protein U9O98_04285 [Asgard group archaeon]|nr:hypothetical protein [Asgard group archaeon]
MRPEERFAKKVKRKPPKYDAKGHDVEKKTGYTRCAICKAKISSSQRKPLRNSFNNPKSQTRTNRPYGGYLCNKCLREQIVKATHALED